MTTTDPALPTSEDGGGLTEEQGLALVETIAETISAAQVDGQDGPGLLAVAIAGRVAPLLSQARADGERDAGERIARTCEQVAAAADNVPQQLAYEHAARIARVQP